ncbi:MAG: DUF2344 domain-containing protein [Chloroflexi bacterium]|nr:DUF2344 domain-containing protein [Chloroflexota bacterium]
MAGLDGPRGRPRFAAAAPLAAAIPGEAELLDVWLTQRLPRWRVRQALAAVLPPGHSMMDVYDVWLGEAPLPGRVTASVYRAGLPPDADLAGVRVAAEALLAAGALPRERQKGEAKIAYDLRPFVQAIEVAELDAVPGAGLAIVGPVLRMTLRHDPEKGIGRPEELLAALEERVGFPLEVRSLVREGLILAASPVVEEPPSRPRPSRPRPGVTAPRPEPGRGR